MENKKSPLGAAIEELQEVKVKIDEILDKYKIHSGISLQRMNDKTIIVCDLSLATYD